MTLAISHHQGGIAVLDAIREVKPPFSPEVVVAEFAVLLKSYHIMTILGDRYAGEWPREQFRKHGITYEPSEKTKSDLYRDLLPSINSCLCDLLDNPKLIQQIVGLERRTARGGRDSIDHAPGAHDDVANAVAGALVKAREPVWDVRLSLGRRSRFGRSWRSRPASSLATPAARGLYQSLCGLAGPQLAQLDASKSAFRQWFGATAAPF